MENERPHKGAFLFLAERVGWTLRVLTCRFADGDWVVRFAPSPPTCGCAAALVEQGSKAQTRSAKMQKAPEGAFHILAERVGFEPTVRVSAHLISNQARSTTPAPLHMVCIFKPGA